jgi:magnesium transporter
MITTIKHKKITWINIESPSAKEVSELAKKYDIHPLVAEELISPTMRPKVDVYENNLYLILHFPSDKESCPTCLTSVGSEIDFVIGKDFLITAHYCKFPSLEMFLRDAKAKKSFREEHFKKHAGILAFNILRELYDHSLRELEQVYIKINRAEEEIFKGMEKQMVKKLSLLKRDVLDFRRAMYPHEGVVKSFESQGEKFFGKSFRHYLGFLSGEYTKVRSLIDNNREMINTLHQTNESLLTTKTNEVMKVLTILAFITFPLMLLSGIFGMNTVSTPIIGIRGDFWIITGVMLLATFGMFLYFKSKKWL